MHLGGQFAGRLEDQRARHARAGAALSSSVSIGKTKDAVLPVPVWAMPRISRFQGLAGLRLPESVLASSSRRQLRRTVLFGLSQDQQKWSIGNVFRFGVCGDARERVVCRGPIGFRIVAAVH
jgi:hypothetical protein